MSQNQTAKRNRWAYPQQALWLLALEPVSETTADHNSYGFRPMRSTHDAIESIFLRMSQKVSPKWILEGDIKGCFEPPRVSWRV
ncbi:hypothetical protein DNX02_25490, partial [Escherichia coli]|nr:hypothetical protein [Escherichia coli]EFD5219202.1 hypothetical protein [Escherichia coli]EFJ3988041.1 hypothetical protein [Escherichia coli]EFK3438178.1 hypothetical protein [Escherichia coli]EFM3931207.1 hypothetical protein [Escherichia coli]